MKKNIFKPDFKLV